MNTFDELLESLGVREKKETGKESFKSIMFGNHFKGLCECLDLDSKIVEKYVLEYSSFKLLQEQYLFSDDDIKLMEKYNEEVITNLTFGEVLDKEFCNSFETYYESFGHVLNNKVETIAFKEKEKIIEAIKNTNQVKKSLNYIKNEGMFFYIYKDWLKRHKKPFNKEGDKLNEVKDIGMLKENTISFLKMLNQLDGLACNEDVFQFENASNMLFIFRCYQLVNENSHKIDSSYEGDFLNILASLCIIEDINLKLYLAKQLIENGNLFDERIYTSLKMFLSNVYMLAIVYPEFIKKNIEIRILNKNKKNRSLVSKEVNQQISMKEEFRNIKDLKQRLYIYEVLGKKKLFNFSEMMDEYEKIEVNNLKLYKSIYLRISSLQSIKKEADQFLIRDITDIVKICVESEMDIESIMSIYSFEIVEKVKTKWRNVRMSYK
ncbi:hypothetical protein [Bacillus cereus group sp. BcHK130]|uniref:hypothetical protein n=1 Tax=Bacillus cereus group sp. BcHK130 TaxID=3018093 RepID=UPI0022E2CC68|nr:hypothetical protein [Bacillus cereus group sp. BcHK130]MDA1928717.1 hypothetical protein [Bacillus cereus group sp. BcHK130]